MNDLETQSLIATHVAAVVPLLIRELEAQGGINAMHLSYISHHADYLGAHGDALQYHVKGATGQAMHKLCEGLAVLAFVPGGVKFAGQHFVGLPAMCAEDVEEVQGLQEALPIEPEPEPEKMPTWAEIFAQEVVESDAVKLGIPVQRVRKGRA